MHDYQLRLLNSSVSPPSGHDVANTLKYFSQMLLGRNLLLSTVLTLFIDFLFFRNLEGCARFPSRHVVQPRLQLQTYGPLPQPRLQRPLHRFDSTLGSGSSHSDRSRWYVYGLCKSSLEYYIYLKTLSSDCPFCCGILCAFKCWARR